MPPLAIAVSKRLHLEKYKFAQGVQGADSFSTGGWADVLAKLEIQKLPDGLVPVREIVLFVRDALVFHLHWLPARAQAVQLLPREGC